LRLKIFEAEKTTVNESSRARVGKGSRVPAFSNELGHREETALYPIQILF